MKENTDQAMDPEKCPGGVYPCLQPVFIPPAVDPNHPWICHTNDWGAEILPDGIKLMHFIIQKTTSIKGDSRIKCRK